MKGVQWTFKSKSNKSFVFSFEYAIFVSSKIISIMKFIYKYTIYG